MKVQITLEKSLIARKREHVRTVHSLGLRHIRATIVQEVNPPLQGKLKQVGYLLNVKEV